VYFVTGCPEFLASDLEAHFDYLFENVSPEVPSLLDPMTPAFQALEWMAFTDGPWWMTDDDPTFFVWESSQSWWEEEEQQPTTTNTAMITANALQVVDLGDNLIEGTISSKIGSSNSYNSWSQLKSLSLYENNISGTIPLELGRLSSLKSSLEELSCPRP
jgi:hypothetical protein